MYKLKVLAVVGILFITTSVFALTDVEVKTYVGKHYQITKKIKAIRDLQINRAKAVNVIKTKYKYDTMMAEIKAANDLYQPQLEQLNIDYKTLMGELELQ